jgi:uncharacterized membrane protein YkvA (DUF1232 family)
MLIRTITMVPLAGRMLRLAWALFWDRRVSPFLKVLPIACAVYIISPIDLAPDFRLGIGQLDDLVVTAVLLTLFIVWSPRDVVSEHLGTGRHRTGGAKTVDGKFRYPDDDQE